ncbi:malto-oligosyltrehalose synthase/4-alpha-glucanotransferase [Pedobacter cryoconitis]|uniref:4-alpha-glucanotransferase n=1 Tax=Pedobacter cryoconitis TaxID=188932 RepID=A0A7W8YXP4_9SPHI|nr:malto-oligosyltrehalose synthase [Pedobacter cryoconitis]MBB5623552.1 malto-oligosyltrehalose synthase/4-alpha-glucanotransferase [Pedobacter cryoconitis]
MFNPISTYRIQFHADFTFNDFRKLIPYLHQLGVKTIYASPIFTAVPGSMHGYDGINPIQINPEIGSLAELKLIAKELAAVKMGWIQDIVPNHMAYDYRNPWLMDVLKKGEQSKYRNHFDIISKDLAKEPLMAPFLGAGLAEEIANEKFSLVKQKGAWFLKYNESYWPLRKGTDLKGSMQEITGQQFYRLCSYQESNERMNYRRFFTVNSLICLNMQSKATFDDFHVLIKELIDQKIFQGLRIDHIDGLFDPMQYLENLRALCGEDVYIVAEKILEPGEVLPKEWPIQGTTGYDYLGLANQLYTNEQSEKKFDKFYKNLTDDHQLVEEQIHEKKRKILSTAMQGELENLFQLLLNILPEGSERLATGDFGVFKHIISELLILCPVYRFYGNAYPLPQQEMEAMEKLFAELEKDKELLKPVQLIKKALLYDHISFYQRLMQFSGPLMAKGVEDTLMYTYSRHIGNNEVGDSPAVFGLKVADFHEAVLNRGENWPLTMNSTATHDTKRGEDARARLSILTDLRGEWLQQVKDWNVLNATDGAAPDENDTYFIYQTLVSTYDEREDREVYQNRFLDYMQKALREAKEKSGWENPDAEYEAATSAFVVRILDTQREFWSVFIDFFRRLAHLGMVKSLSSLILKHGVPGIPDTYQGTELWDFSMVDPDNRRAVDYGLRKQYMEDFLKKSFNIKLLWQESSAGEIKLLILQKLLKFRAEYAELFRSGLYIPLKVTGTHAADFIAFARRYQTDWAIFVVPVNVAALLTEQKSLHFGLGDTQVVLPAEAPLAYVDLIENQSCEVKDSVLVLQDVFKSVPFGILHQKVEHQERGAGILMHITSLPSAFGIGDLGPEAINFIDFLAASGQKYWQILPLNPVLDTQAYSPYASSSVMAANPVLISPELLIKDGLLENDDFKTKHLKVKRKVNFASVVQKKKRLLNLAYEQFKQKFEGKDQEFSDFSSSQAYWLEDYAVYEVLKTLNADKPWYEWPSKLKNKDLSALSEFKAQHEDEINEVKWYQFIFFRQWKELKAYAVSLNIKLIGDLPFYAALDSCDVWANQELFEISSSGEMKGVAGVPPDYFNADGQLWGMPVYNWKAMEKSKYDWWVQRIRRNIDLYDLIRLDHFRAFSSYWEVPAGSSSAKFGSWKKGPGRQVFDILAAQFGNIPFIAEDLGEIDVEVVALRDHYELPGMKVLQFAFGEDSPASVHAPHNFTSVNCLAYTGTHDNNTTRNWYEKDINQDDKARINSYTGLKVSKGNIAHVLIRLAYASTANVVIVPVQDILNKGAKARMNVPASVKRNWVWRVKSRELNDAVRVYLHDLVKLYGRS